MKLVISKNKEGNGYYSKLTNEYNGKKSEMYLSLQLSKELGELEYGLYEVDGFMSCYTAKDGVKPKMIITKAKKVEKKPELEVNEKVKNDPYADFGQQIELTDEDLPF
jgi:hypothetical protein